MTFLRCSLAVEACRRVRAATARFDAILRMDRSLRKERSGCSAQRACVLPVFLPERAAPWRSGIVARKLPVRAAFAGSFSGTGTREVAR